jgi:hypothetical protein
MQEWQLIENTAMTENQRFKTAEIYMVYFTNITHKPSYNLKQCFSTGVPRNPRVPWMTSKGSVKFAKFHKFVGFIDTYIG